MTNLLVFTDLAISVTSGKKLFCKRYKRKAAYVSHSPDKRHPTLFLSLHNPPCGWIYVHHCLKKHNKSLKVCQTGQSNFTV